MKGHGLTEGGPPPPSLAVSPRPPPLPVISPMSFMDFQMPGAPPIPPFVRDPGETDPGDIYSPPSPSRKHRRTDGRKKDRSRRKGEHSKHSRNRSAMEDRDESPAVESEGPLKAFDSSNHGTHEPKRSKEKRPERGRGKHRSHRTEEGKAIKQENQLVHSKWSDSDRDKVQLHGSGTAKDGADDSEYTVDDDPSRPRPRAVSVSDDDTDTQVVSKKSKLAGIKVGEGENNRKRHKKDREKKSKGRRAKEAAHVTSRDPEDQKEVKTSRKEHKPRNGEGHGDRHRRSSGKHSKRKDGKPPKGEVPAQTLDTGTDPKVGKSPKSDKRKGGAHEKGRSRKDIVILKPDQVLNETFLLAHYPVPIVPLHISPDLVAKAVELLTHLKADDKVFKQSYILWHLFCESGHDQPAFKFFKYKEAVVGDCLLLLKGYTEKASCLAALPGVTQILQALASPCKQYAKTKTAVFWLELVQLLGYSLTEVLGPRMPNFASDGTPEVVDWTKQVVELFTSAYLEIFFASRCITREEEVVQRLEMEPKPEPKPQEDPTQTIRLVGALEDMPESEVRFHFVRHIGLEPLAIRRDRVAGMWLVDLGHPEKVAYALRNGEDVPMGGVVATVCHLNDNLSDTAELERLEISLRPDRYQDGDAETVRSMEFALASLLREASLTGAPVQTEMRRQACALVARIWGIVDFFLSRPVPMLRASRELMLSAEGAVLPPSCPEHVCFYNDSERMEMMMGCHQRMADIERRWGDLRLAAEFRSKALEAEIKLRKWRQKPLSAIAKAIERFRIVKYVCVDCIKAGLCARHTFAEPPPAPPQPKIVESIEGYTLQFTLDLPSFPLPPPAEPLPPTVVAKSSNESRAYRLLGRGIQHRIPDLVMAVREQLKAIPTTPLTPEVHQTLLMQLKQKMREFKSQLAEEPKMKENWRHAIRKERERDREYLEKQKQRQEEQQKLAAPPASEGPTPHTTPPAPVATLGTIPTTGVPGGLGPPSAPVSLLPRMPTTPGIPLRTVSSMAMPSMSLPLMARSSGVMDSMGPPNNFMPQPTSSQVPLAAPLALPAPPTVPATAAAAPPAAVPHAAPSTTPNEKSAKKEKKPKKKEKESKKRKKEAKEKEKDRDRRKKRKKEGTPIEIDENDTEQPSGGQGTKQAAAWEMKDAKLQEMLNKKWKELEELDQAGGFDKSSSSASSYLSSSSTTSERSSASAASSRSGSPTPSSSGSETSSTRSSHASSSAASESSEEADGQELNTKKEEAIQQMPKPDVTTQALVVHTPQPVAPGRWLRPEDDDFMVPLDGSARNAMVPPQPPAVPHAMVAMPGPIPPPPIPMQPQPIAPNAMPHITMPVGPPHLIPVTSMAPDMHMLRPPTAMQDPRRPFVGGLGDADLPRPIVTHRFLPDPVDMFRDSHAIQRPNWGMPTPVLDVAPIPPQVPLGLFSAPMPLMQAGASMGLPGLPPGARPLDPRLM